MMQSGKGESSVIVQIVIEQYKRPFFLALENFFSIDIKFKMLVTMKEGTVPVPPHRPCAER